MGQKLIHLGTYAKPGRVLVGPTTIFTMTKSGLRGRLEERQDAQRRKSLRGAALSSMKQYESALI